MPEWIDFTEIRSRISLEDVLFRFYRLDGLTRTGDKVIGPCPVHGGDSPRAFHAELSRNLWHCFSQCKGGGNQLDFVARREAISIREAALRLQQFFLAEGRNTPAAPSQAPRATGVRHDVPAHPTDPAPAPPRRHGVAAAAPVSRERDPDPPAANPPLAVRLNLKYEHPHLLKDRGLSLETLRYFDVGHCSRGIMRGMICFPIHDAEGELVAYAGRRLRPSDIAAWGKYKFPKGFKKELVLYNYHRATERMAAEGLILVEGFFSVLKLREAGLENVVASMGCEVSAQQLELLALAPEVIVLFDGNEAGYGGAERVRERLAARTTVRVARLPEGLEPEDLSPRALRWLVNGLRALDLAAVTFWVRPGR